ncbi:MAG: hypothetical protein EOO77_03955 [Oxalobacteraceae bacterium]|nr:MAG: hypothetical protein EOO77_03955 [Oxalobacteraceae bacterium]
MTRVERAARALCRFDGLPEDAMYEGRPMWESFVSLAAAALAAVDEEDAPEPLRPERPKGPDAGTRRRR